MALIRPLPQDQVFMMQHGIMLPDYYRGSAGITLQVPVGPQTTIGAMLDAIESEFNQYEIHEPIANYGASARRIARFFAEWIEDVRKDNDLSVLLDASLEHDECYQFFSIEFNAK